MIQKLGPALLGAVIGILLFWGMTKLVRSPEGPPPELRAVHVALPAPTPVEEASASAQRDPQTDQPPSAVLQTAGIRGQEAPSTGIRGTELRDEVVGTMVERPGGVDQPALEQPCVDRELAPRVLIAPDYPVVARRDGVEGQVEVEFTVEADGSVSAATVVSASQGQVFDTAALAAVQRWRFMPRTVACEPVAARVRQVLEFRLDE